MEEKGLREFLKHAGKQEHVASGLVAQVQAFETYLACQRHTRLDAARPWDIRSYAETLPSNEMRKRMRALALYLKFAGDASLAKVAAESREKEITKGGTVLRRIRL